MKINKGGNRMRFLVGVFIISLLAFSVSGFDFNLQKQDSGVVSGLEGKILSLTIDGENEVGMQLDRVGSQRVMITLLDTGKVVVLDLGQSKEVDLDNDEVNDVKIDVNNIIDKLVSLKITKIGFVESTETDTIGSEDVEDLIEDIDEDIEEVKEDLEEVTGDAVVADVTGALGNYGKWIVGVIIVIIILTIVAFVYKGGETSERFYGKATDLHREGQEFHWDGDDETAEELYEKASEFREKARNLEGGF